MSRLTILAFGMVGLCSTTTWAAEIHVPMDQATIQAGINAAMPGDEVIVAAGSYNETISLAGKAITLRSADPDDPAVVMATIIDGTGFTNTIRCLNGEGPDTLITGFTITGGIATGAALPTDRGGGIVIMNANPTITKCSFFNNQGINGAAVYVFNGDPHFQYCSFIANISIFGGGIYNDAASTVIEDCVFFNNTANNQGAGIYNLNPGSVKISSCTFSFNGAQFGGGGIFNAASVPIISGSGFCGNVPDQISGAFGDDGGNSMQYCAPPLPPVDICPADGDNDGDVGVLDFLKVLAEWGACP